MWPSELSFHQIVNRLCHDAISFEVCELLLFLRPKLRQDERKLTGMLGSNLALIANLRKKEASRNASRSASNRSASNSSPSSPFQLPVADQSSNLSDLSSVSSSQENHDSGLASCDHSFAPLPHPQPPFDRSPYLDVPHYYHLPPDPRPITLSYSPLASPTHLHSTAIPTLVVNEIPGNGAGSAAPSSRQSFSPFLIDDAALKSMMRDAMAAQQSVLSASIAGNTSNESMRGTPIDSSETVSEFPAPNPLHVAIANIIGRPIPVKQGKSRAAVWLDC